MAKRLTPEYESMIRDAWNHDGAYDCECYIAVQAILAVLDDAREELHTLRGFKQGAIETAEHARAEIAYRREQCRAAEERAERYRAGLQRAYDERVLPWKQYVEKYGWDDGARVTEAWLPDFLSAAPAPEPEQRPVDAEDLASRWCMRCSAQSPMLGPSARGGWQVVHEAAYHADQPQPPLGRHAGLAGQEGEGT